MPQTKAERLRDARDAVTNLKEAIAVLEAEQTERAASLLPMYQQKLVEWEGLVQKLSGRKP